MALASSVTGSGPPVLLIQGVSAQGDCWRPQVDALAPRWRCLTFDNRGVGGSPAPAGPLTVETMAEDALALLDAQGWSSAHVVGHSLGGVVAQRLALATRARVRSLALLCTFARGADATGVTARMAWIGLRMKVGTRAARARAFLEIVAPPRLRATAAEADALAARLGPLFGHDLVDQPSVVSAQLRALGAWDATAALGALAGLPTLVVSGRHDPLSRPDVAARLAAAIPGARHVALDDAAHGLTLTHAQRTNALLEDHLAAAERAWSTA